MCSPHLTPSNPDFPSCLQVYTLLDRAKGGFSGGTIASGMNMAAKEPLEELKDMGSNAYYLAGLAGG